MDLALKVIRWVIWIVCSGLIVLNLFALYNVLLDPSSQIINETDPALAFYTSREMYISLLLLFTLSLVAMIYFSYKRSWHVFFISLFIAFGLLFFILRISVITPAP